MFSQRMLDMLCDDDAAIKVSKLPSNLTEVPKVHEKYEINSFCRTNPQYKANLKTMEIPKWDFSSRLFSFANPHIWQIQIIDMYSYQKKVARKLKSKRLHFLCYKSYFISVPVILTTAATYLSYSLSLHVAARLRTQLKTLIEKVLRSLKLPHFLCTFFRTSKQNISS